LNKFTENRYEKLERLFEIHAEVLERLQLADKKRQTDEDNLQRLVAEEIEITDEDIYLQRCEDGLSKLQMVDMIILRLGNMGNIQITEAMKVFCVQKNVQRKDILQIVIEYCDHLDPVKGASEKQELLLFAKNT